MHVETFELGSAFSDWSELTDEYVAGLQALRRREPGASERMMRIAKLMSEYQLLVMGGTAPAMALPTLEKPPVPWMSSWFVSTAAALFRTTGNLPQVH